MNYVLLLGLYLLMGFIVFIFATIFETRDMSLKDFKIYFFNNKYDIFVTPLIWPIYVIAFIVMIPFTILQSNKFIEILYSITRINKNKKDEKDNI